MLSAWEPRKRRKIQHTCIEQEIDDLSVLRKRNEQKLEGRFAAIYAKYGRDFGEASDVVDLFTGSVLENRGHLQHMRHERDVGRLRPRAEGREMVGDGVLHTEDDELTTLASRGAESVWAAPEAESDEEEESTPATLAAQIIKAAMAAGRHKDVLDPRFLQELNHSLLDQMSQAIPRIGIFPDSSTIASCTDATLKPSQLCPKASKASYQGTNKIPLVRRPERNDYDCESSWSGEDRTKGIRGLKSVRSSQPVASAFKNSQQKLSTRSLEGRQERSKRPQRASAKKPNGRFHDAVITNLQPKKKSGKKLRFTGKVILRSDIGPAMSSSQRRKPARPYEESHEKSQRRITWSDSEHLSLLEFVKQMGEDFTDITSHIPGRNPTSAKFHFWTMRRPDHKYYDLAIEARLAARQRNNTRGNLDAAESSDVVRERLHRSSASRKSEARTNHDSVVEVPMDRAQLERETESHSICHAAHVKTTDAFDESRSVHQDFADKTESESEIETQPHIEMEESANEGIDSPADQDDEADTLYEEPCALDRELEQAEHPGTVAPPTEDDFDTNTAVQSVELREPMVAEVNEEEDELSSDNPSPFSLGSPFTSSVGRELHAVGVRTEAFVSSPLAARIRQMGENRPRRRLSSSGTGSAVSQPVALLRSKKRTSYDRSALPTPMSSSPLDVKRQSCDLQGIVDVGSDDELGH